MERHLQRERIAELRDDIGLVILFKGIYQGCHDILDERFQRLNASGHKCFGHSIAEPGMDCSITVNHIGHERVPFAQLRKHRRSKSYYGT